MKCSLGPEYVRTALLLTRKSGVLRDHALKVVHSLSGLRIEEVAVALDNAPRLVLQVGVAREQDRRNSKVVIRVKVGICVVVSPIVLITQRSGNLRNVLTVAHLVRICAQTGHSVGVNAGHEALNVWIRHVDHRTTRERGRREVAVIGGDPPLA